MPPDVHRDNPADRDNDGYLGIRKLNGEYIQLRGEQQVADYFALLGVSPGDNRIPPFDRPDENPMAAPAACEGFLWRSCRLRNPQFITV